MPLTLIHDSYYVASMNNISVSYRSIMSGAVVSFSAFVFLIIIMILPSHAAAQTASIQTQELLPPGQDACQVVTVTDVEPHVYGGVLESFDVTISDTSNSYVGVLAQVGNSAVPLNYITRWAGTPSGLKIHVDTTDTTIDGVVPVTLALISSPAGAPTCISTIAFDVTNASSVAPYVSTSIPQAQAGNSAPVQTSPVSTSATTPTGTVSGTTGTNSASGNPVAKNGTTTAVVTAASVTSAGNMKFFSSVCTGNNAYRLWFILLVIYILIVATVVFAEPWFLETSVLSSTAAMLVPLILLLIFWYFSETCRAASWIPVVACVIAIVGLFLAFREYEMPPLLAAPSNQ
jgi:hypothetical protein